MKNLYLLFCSVFSFPVILLAQQPAYSVFHTNEIRTGFSADGRMFSDLQNGGAFLVPYEGIQTPSTIFNGALWLGTMDENTLRVAAQTYGTSSQKNDFYPGPLDPVSGLPVEEGTANNFNKVWTVFRHEIEKHIADFSDNNLLDDPVLAVVGWPAKGNPYFNTVNGFELPAGHTSLAPFFDLNNDGNYNAFDGDYPLPEGVVPGVLPGQLTWLVYNDVAGPHLQTGGAPLGVEIQMTAWAFETDDPLLDKTLFVSNKIINRSGKDYSDVRLGVWTDLSIGCYTDDFVGCIPPLNAYYAYNGDMEDGSGACSISGYSGYGNRPPVQAVTILNHTLDGFSMYKNQSVGDPQPDVNMTDPWASGLEFYNYLDHKWRDGTPLTKGGNGYDPGSSDFTDFIFPGNPNVPGEWSQYAENAPSQDPRALGVLHLPEFKNGEIKTIDVAYSTHSDPNLNHLETVNLLYAEIPLLQQHYAAGFSNLSPRPLCEYDCLWPGDANNDGIADQFDLFAIGAANGASGPLRNGPLSWAPYISENWNGASYGGINMKHADCNGDGIVNKVDIDIVELHFGEFNDQYIKTEKRKSGNDVYFSPKGALSNRIFEKGEQLLPLLSVNKKAVPDLTGLAFTVEFDTAFFSNIKVITVPGMQACFHTFGNGDFTSLATISHSGELHFSILNKGGAGCRFENEKLFSLLITPADAVPANSTLIRFKNIKGLLNDNTVTDLGGEDIKLFFLNYGEKESTKKPPGIHIYPNPSTGVFYFNLVQEEVFKVHIYDARGRLINVQPAFHQKDYMIDLRSYPTGVYFLKLTQGRETVTKKLVVSK
ncbi:MAG TPA: T9SS type A sorting domain-containing protein [Bacteroidetes bacterium]|nr:T9SS type A sorting domain-containing protein [Bacteroidota bacterium]